MKIKVTTPLIKIEMETLEEMASAIILHTAIKLIEKAAQASRDMEVKIRTN